MDSDLCLGSEAIRGFAPYALGSEAIRGFAPYASYAIVVSPIALRAFQ